MGVDAGSVYSSIRIRLTDLDNDLKGVYARLGQLETNITKTTVPAQKNFKDMFAAVFTGQAALDLAKNGFEVLTGFIKDSTKVARDSQEMISKYDVVFGGMGSQAEEAAKRFSDSFDLAGATAKEMLSNTGNLLQGLGATKEESLKLSVEVNTLASDLASFTNNQGGSKAASEALTKALLGEKESMKTLGIAILDSDVNARVAKNGQDELTGTALKLAKAQATLQLITEQSKNAIGDYARTQDSAANTQKRAEESTKKLQIALGTALNPAATLAADIWARVASSLSDVITKQGELKKADLDVANGAKSTATDIETLDAQYKKLKEDADALRAAGREESTIYKEIEAELKNIELKKLTIKYTNEAAQQKQKASETIAKWSETEKSSQQKVIDKYKEQKKVVDDILKGNQTEYEKIQDQIDSINLAWEKGTVNEKDRQKAIEILIQKQQALVDAENKAAQEKTKATSDLITDIYSLGEAEKSEAQKAIEGFNSKIDAAVEAGTIYKSTGDTLKKVVSEYYKTLEDETATKKFVENLNNAVSLISQGISSIGELVTAITQQAAEDQAESLDKQYEALSESLSARQELEDAALKASQDANKKALDQKYNDLLTANNAELQAELYKLGLVGAATVEQFQKELEEAKKTGDEKKIKEAQDAYDKAKLQEEYAAKEKSLKEQQAKAQAELEKQQAADTAALDKKQKEEKEKLEDDKAKKLAKINYDANLAQWQVQLAMATATAAQAVLNAYNSQIVLPIIGPISGAAAAGIAAAFGAVQVAAVVAAKPQLKYATGGIVPGTSYTGDNIIAGLNSGERVLTASQNAAMYDMMVKYMNGESQSGKQVVLNVGTLIADPAGLRELNRQLSKYGNIEEKRVGKK